MKFRFVATRAKAIILAMAASIALALPAEAQDSLATVTLAGVVRDTSGRLLPGAEVRSGERYTITSDSGTFVLGGLAPDTVELLVRRIGFRPVVTAFVIKPGLTVTVAVRMTPSDVTLGTIVVEGKKVDARLWKTGFYQRAKLGMGSFFTPDELEHRGSTISGLIREVPSVNVDRDRMNRAVPMGRFGGGWCRMNVFIDGQLARWATDVGLDDVLPKSEILAVEVYPRAALVPSVLVGSATASTSSGGGAVAGVSGATANSMMTSQGQRSDCGAIFIWTKPFEAPGG